MDLLLPVRDPGRVQPLGGRLDGRHLRGRHAGQRLLADTQRWAHPITPTQVLSQIGSPFAPDQQPLPARYSTMQHKFPGSI
jgi:hypothetical protein